MKTAMLSLGFFAGVCLCGPDLVCSEINGSTSFGVVDGIAAYSFGTTVCNIGDEPVEYDANSNQHPLYAQSIYRLKDHRIEQIGIGFVRHTTVPLASNACGLGCTPAGFTALGVGCSDSSSSSVNGVQGLMGPRTEVNAQTGAYPYPFTSINQSGDAIYKRVQVDLADVSDPDALYFVETQVIVPDEETAEARNNNVSYRQVQFAPGSASATLVGPTYAQQPAVFAWRDHGNGIGMADEGVLINEATIPHSDEVFVLASRVEALSQDLWRFDYAIYNMNGERGIREIGISLPDGPDTFVLSTETKAPTYHSDLDDQILNTNWVTNPEYDGELSTETYQVNPNANAVRWGTMYRLAFVIQTPLYCCSHTESVGIGFFGPNEPPFAEYGFTAYSPPHSDPSGCGQADLNQDSQLNFFDVSLFLQDYNAGGDYNGDGSTNFFDVSAFLTDYNAGCQ